MDISIEEFEKLTREEKEFVLRYGSDNCVLGILDPGLGESLSDIFGEIDGKWHLLYVEDDAYYLADDIALTEECLQYTCRDIEALINQRA